MENNVSKFENVSAEKIRTDILAYKRTIETIEASINEAINELIQRGELVGPTMNGNAKLTISTTIETVNQTIARQHMDAVCKANIKAKEKKAIAGVKISKTDCSPAMLAIDGLVEKVEKISTRWTIN